MRCSSTPGRTWWRFGLFVIVVAAMATAGRLFAPDLSRLAADPTGVVAAGVGWTGVLGFIALYAVAVTALLPGSLLAIASGVALGWKLGLLVAVTASNVGALLSFLIARSLGRDVAQRLLSRRLPRLEKGAAALGFEALLALRLMSVVPFLNYASGLSAVRLGDFVLASLLGMFPSTLLFVLIGSNLNPLSPRFWILSGLALLVAVLPMLARRRARRAAAAGVAGR